MIRGETSWWIAVEGRAYGPYAFARLHDFLLEGRFTATSLVATEAEGPYGPAHGEPELRGLFERSVRAAVAPPTRASASSGSAGAGPGALRQASGPLRVLLVTAEVTRTTPEAFERSLASLGDVVRAGSGAWFVAAAVGPTSLRNLLSRGLHAGEHFIVAEARAPDTAWFALDGEVDRAVRRLWEDASG